MDTITPITFEDFLKVDIRAGVITKAERLENSKKLLKLATASSIFCSRSLSITPPPSLISSSGGSLLLSQHLFLFSPPH